MSRIGLPRTADVPSFQSANQYYGPKDFKIPNCAVCGNEVKANEKVIVERRTLHLNCFKCAICGVQLEFGECAMDEHLSRYGPTWFCLNHHLLPPKQKEAFLEKRGYKFRETGSKAKK